MSVASLGVMGSIPTPCRTCGGSGTGDGPLTPKANGPMNSVARAERDQPKDLFSGVRLCLHGAEDLSKASEGVILGSLNRRGREGSVIVGSWSPEGWPVLAGGTLGFGVHGPIVLDA